MGWTDNPPTENGYYWWRDSPRHRPRILCVVRGAIFMGTLTEVTPGKFRGEWTRPAAEQGGQWNGPIAEPKG